MDLMTTFTTVRQSLIERYPKLTRVELKICTLIKLNFSSKEIANVLCLSKRTIDCHRWRLTKKLEVPEGSTLALVVASV
jgi:FixJ family two-component response regulator